MIADLVRGLEALPPKARERAEQIVALQDKENLNCSLVARYVGLFSDVLYDRNRIELLRFEAAPDVLPNVRSVSEPEPGDLVVFRMGHFPEHFGIFIGKDRIFSMCGMEGPVTVESVQELLKSYHADNVLYLRRE